MVEVHRVINARGPQGGARQRYPGRLLAPGEFVPPAGISAPPANDPDRLAEFDELIAEALNKSGAGAEGRAVKAAWRRFTLPSGGRSANPGEPRLHRPPAEALRPRRRRAGALTPRETASCKSDHEAIGELARKVLVHAVRNPPRRGRPRPAAPWRAGSCLRA